MWKQSDAQAIFEIKKQKWRESFVEDVGILRWRWNMQYSNVTECHFVTYKVYVYLNMFGALVLDWIGWKIDGTDIIAEDKSVMLERLLQLKEDWRRLHTQVVSTTALATTLYTASALDREVVACRLDDQETRLSPKNTR